MQEASIAFMAGTMAWQWRRSLACHLHTVSQPWPHRDLQQVTSQLLVQCANEWGLPLPPVPDASPTPPTQVCLAAHHCCAPYCLSLPLHTTVLYTSVPVISFLQLSQYWSDMHGIAESSCSSCMSFASGCSELYPAVIWGHASHLQQLGCLYVLHMLH